MSKKILLLAGLTVAALSACKYADVKRAQINAKPDFSTIAVNNFDINRYMGEWHEIEPPRVSRRPNFLREYPNEKYLFT